MPPPPPSPPARSPAPAKPPPTQLWRRPPIHPTSIHPPAQPPARPTRLDVARTLLSVHRPRPSASASLPTPPTPRECPLHSPAHPSTSPDLRSPAVVPS